MVRRYLGVIAMLACGAMGAMTPALAQSRMALVIGNSAYQSVTALTNPAHDAQAVAQILNSAGFDVVLALDLTQAGMRQTIQEFAASVAGKGADNIALVYYAGHGLQIDGENFLVPVDAAIQQEGDVAANTFALADLMKALEAVPSSARIVILDACRNNPFTAIQKATGRGLAIVDAPDGSIVAYSTAPGSEALDGTGNNSPYTSALVETVKQPGLPIEQLFKEVRLRVHKATDGHQTPWETSSLTVNFAFFAAVVAVTPPEQPSKVAATTPQPVKTATTAPTPITVSHSDAAADKAARLAKIRTLPPAEAYDYVIEEDSVDAYQDFIDVYSSDPLCDRVRRILFRREQMVAWRNATLTNTPDSYESYLQRYPYSDHAATAARLHVDPRPVSIDPIIAPRNFPFPRFPGQFGQQPPFGGPQKQPGQNGPVVSIPPSQGGSPGKPGGSNTGTPPGPTGNTPPGTVIHLPGGVKIDTPTKTPVTTPGTVVHLPPGGVNVNTPTKNPVTTPGTVVHLPGGVNVDTPTKTPVTSPGTVVHLPPGGVNVVTPTKTPVTGPGGVTVDTPTKTPVTSPGTIVHLPPGGINVNTPTKTPVTTPGTIVRLPTGGPDKTPLTTNPGVVKSPIVTPGSSVNHLPPVVSRASPINQTPVSSTHLPPVTNSNPVRNQSPIKNFSQVAKPTQSFSTPFRNPGGGGGGGGGGNFSFRR
jgi:uncharacterized caspase-like protein